MFLERLVMYRAADRFVKDVRKLPSEIKDNTIILIGPIGTGKSTIAQILLSRIEGIQRLSLDSKVQFGSFYKKRRSFHNYKNFDFALTGTVLSTLKTPCVIDFGAIHSVYSDEFLREKMKEICSQFRNVILLLPSNDNNKSRRILLERRNATICSRHDSANWHFLIAPNNYELATDIIYEEGKSPEEIAEEILELINQKNRNNRDAKEER